MDEVLEWGGSIAPSTSIFSTESRWYCLFHFQVSQPGRARVLNATNSSAPQSTGGQDLGAPCHDAPEYGYHNVCGAQHADEFATPRHTPDTADHCTNMRPSALSPLLPLVFVPAASLVLPTRVLPSSREPAGQRSFACREREKRYVCSSLNRRRL